MVIKAPVGDNINWLSVLAITKKFYFGAHPKFNK